MNEQPNAYYVYIIRVWCEQSTSQGQPIVRFMLEVPGTERRHGFVSATSLLEALGDELAPIGESAGNNG